VHENTNKMQKLSVNNFLKIDIYNQNKNKSKKQQKRKKSTDVTAEQIQQN